MLLSRVGLSQVSGFLLDEVGLHRLMEFLRFEIMSIMGWINVRLGFFRSDLVHVWVSRYRLGFRFTISLGREL